ncbi:MAG: hypothetical protein Q8P20_08485 [bacterium]|nr:hypothetical protein [bacterium]
MKYRRTFKKGVIMFNNDKPKMKRKIRIGYTNKKFNRKMFLALMESQLYTKEFPLVVTAYDLAKYGHRNQLRGDKVRYFEHCKAVALIIMFEFRVFLVNPIIVGLLHDVKEDSYILSWWAVEKLFGKDIYRGIRIVTKEEDKEYYFGIENVPEDDWWIILVKLADRLHNMRNILHQPKDFQLRQLEETEKLFPHLIDVFNTKVPKRFDYLPDYIRYELQFACNKIRKQNGILTSKAFKRVE